jgi:riboflavin kinase/FMN adenylyltransferase
LTWLDDIPDGSGTCVLSIGNFDGVHVGHRAIIARAREFADQHRLPLNVLTFDPHPLVVVAPARAPQMMEPLELREQRLRDAGAGRVVVARSEPTLLGMEAAAFVDAIICRRFAAACVVEGATFGFGAGRRGNVKLLRALGESRGFRVEIVEPVSVMLPDGRAVQVSSSAVREAMFAGRVEDASALLGRPPVLLGRVVHGHGRGRDLGFATANLDCGDLLVPGDGVYAGSAEMDGRSWPAAISIGRSPTFGEGPRQVEAHLIGCDENVYDQRMRVTIVARLRDQRRFASPEELRRQIEGDVQRTRQMVADAGPLT